jgi:hypothetical protein
MYMHNHMCCSEVRIQASCLILSPSVTLLLQVEAKLAAAAACCGSSVLSQLNHQLLGRVLAAVRAAEPFTRDDPQQRSASIQQLRPVGCVMKVQN